jgi:hypothetical protein
MKHGKGALICWYTDKFWPNSVRSVKLIILGCCTEGVLFYLEQLDILLSKTIK